ncbi:hypothetical protein [Candidatus Solirubrobacter pratensis]|uniref:hypothetical protein n=1 Tax=Candidatus Solirubrobacter pratensis TaxID=1298857 RepID=UPI0012DC62E5|nr:hypothetical protein [Candidatus Solirubrobacter pratensis]
MAEQRMRLYGDGPGHSVEQRVVDLRRRIDAQALGRTENLRNAQRVVPHALGDLSLDRREPASEALLNAAVDEGV